LGKVRFSRLMVCWVAMLALLFGTALPSNALAVGDKVNYVALGDSLAAGQTPDRKIDKGYTGILEETLRQQNVLASYTNKYAVPGYTTQNVLDDLVNNKEVDGIKIQNVIKVADIITITAGANDLLREANINPTTGTVTIDPQKALAVAATVKANLKSILDNVKALNPSAKVYLSGYYNAFPYISADQQLVIKQILAAFNGIIQQTALENGATFVSLDGIFDANVSAYLPNPLDIHPSLAGYQLIARAFINLFVLPPTPAPTPEPKQEFEDVTESFWAYKEISLLVEGKVLAGTSDGQFEPEKAISRAEVAQALFKLIPFDKSIPENPGFSDVPESHEAYMAIAKLTKAGVFAKATTFNPNAPLTRGQMAKVLALSFQLKPTGTVSFKDVPTNYWAAAYINALAVSNVTVGFRNNTFQPAAATNRAQFAAFLVRAANTVTAK
jgi:lysophospholipase L1-like esterase